MAPPSVEELAAWPDAFIPGKVAVLDHGGQPHYAFTGEAEDYFPGEGLETEAELHDEAILDAKARFYAVMSGGDPTRVVGLSGAFVAYRWAEGPMRYVVCMVPVSAVTITPAVEEEAPRLRMPFRRKKKRHPMVATPIHPNSNQNTVNDHGQRDERKSGVTCGRGREKGGRFLGCVQE